MVQAYDMLINGTWTNGSGAARLDSINPYTQDVWATIPLATADDVNCAVEAAHNAFTTTWKKVNGRDRALMLNRLAELVEYESENLAKIESIDNGKAIRETLPQMKFVARNYRYFSGFADKLQGNTIPLDNGEMLDYTLIEPLGVTVLITAWNSPLSLLANKLAPALAAGNTVIIKPSEYASASTLEFGRLINKAGFPDGVVNIVTGNGSVGEALTSHPHVRKISFTGGLSTARSIIRNSAERIVPVTTELGGKSPNIIFEDADFSAATNGAVAGIFGASGQTCIAGSRLLVQESIYDDICTRVLEKVQEIHLGDPLNPTTEVGPVANAVQFDRILAMIAQAKSEGAKVVCGGHKAKGPGLDQGYFIEPTVLVDLEPTMEIVRNEVFGPVLCILPFKDEADAIRLANDSDFGLASGVWTNDLKRAHRMARDLEAGLVWVNTYRASFVGAPFGGTKLSGHGRERSWHALMEYTQVKNIMLDLSSNDRDPFVMKL